MADFYTDNIPMELREVPQWVCWNMVAEGNDKPKKIPIDAKTGKPAKTNDPSTFSDFFTVVEYARKYMCTGIGFVFTENDDYVGVDIDHCFDTETGELNDIANEILSRQSTYAELSPSGTGLHLIFRGKKPSGSSKNSSLGVEMYDAGRYFTVTGNIFLGSSSHVETAKPDTLSWIMNRFIDNKANKNEEKSVEFSQPSTAHRSLLSDDELLKKARKAKNGDTLKKLYNGDWESIFGSQSEADYALCCSLAFWSGKDPDQMDRIFRQSKLMRPKWDESHGTNGETYGNITISNAIAHTESVYKQSDYPIFEKNGSYWRICDDSSYQITNFLIEPVEMVIGDDDTELTADFVSNQGKKVRKSFSTTDLCGTAKFKAMLCAKDFSLCFYGKDGDLEHLKEYIAVKDWPEKRGVTAAGVYDNDGEYVYVSADGCVDKNLEPVSNIVQLDKYVQIRSDILQAKPLDEDGLKVLGKLILSYNVPEKTIPLLGWVGSVFVRAQLRDSHVKQPHLFLVGEAGSGKSTTLESVILPIFSTHRVLAATQATMFPILKEASSSNLIPLAFDEFKPSKIDPKMYNKLCNFLRDSYDEHSEERGRADQTLAVYHLLAPVIIAGEESSDETAIAEREIKLFFSKRDITNDNVDALNKLKSREDLLHDFGLTLLRTGLSLSKADVYEWYESAASLFDSRLHSRIRSNLRVCYCGLKLVEKVCQSLGLSWDDVFSIPIDDCAKKMEASTIDYLLDGSLHSRSIVEKTLEIISRMDLDPIYDYFFEDNGNTLCIRLGEVYDKFTEYRRTHDIRCEVLSLSEFQKQLEHSDFFLAKSYQKRIGNRNCRFWKLRFDTLKTRCDVEGFENSRAEPLVGPKNV